jgi:enoyl-CoA hydratase/carnithine racemase
VSQLIRYEVEDGIGTLTLDRPAKRNAMTYAMLGEFIDTLGRAGRDPGTRVIVLTGSGGSFCAGTDLADLATVPGAERGLRGRAQERGRWWPIVDCPLPVIAAVDGPAVGMGAEFTSQCDIRIGTPDARFAWNFAERGLVPDTGAGSWLLPRLIGVQRALRLLYTGEFMGAEEALAIGYLDRLVAREALLPTALDVARRIAAASPFSQRRIKSLVYEGLGADIDAHMGRHANALAECFKSSDHAEGVAAFLERRPAQFTGH